MYFSSLTRTFLGRHISCFLCRIPKMSLEYLCLPKNTGAFAGECLCKTYNTIKGCQSSFWYNSKHGL